MTTFTEWTGNPREEWFDRLNQPCMNTGCDGLCRPERLSKPFTVRSQQTIVLAELHNPTGFALSERFMFLICGPPEI